MTIAGISVARQFPRNRNITRTTSSNASARLFKISLMEISMNLEVSYGTTQLTPLGKYLAISVILALTALTVSSAFAPGVKRIAIAAVGWPSMRAALL